jgi:hypothetical protein
LDSSGGIRRHQERALPDERISPLQATHQIPAGWEAAHPILIRLPVLREPLGPGDGLLPFRFRDGLDQICPQDREGDGDGALLQPGGAGRARAAVMQDEGIDSPRVYGRMRAGEQFGAGGEGRPVHTLLPDTERVCACEPRQVRGHEGICQIQPGGVRFMACCPPVHTTTRAAGSRSRISSTMLWAMCHSRSRLTVSASERRPQRRRVRRARVMPAEGYLWPFEG